MAEKPRRHGGARASRAGSLSIELTRTCNRSCDYCYNVWKSASPYPDAGELPTAEFTSLIGRVLDECGFNRVLITGGEPLLRPDWLDVVDFIHSLGISMSLVTDGGLIDDRIASELARRGVAPVQPTLLSADRDRHDRIKGCECFDATVSAIARLVRRRVPISVAFVCTRANWSEFRSVVELCFALGVKAIAFNRFCATGQGGTSWRELMPSSEQLTACLEVAEWANTRLEMDVRIAISLPLCCSDLSRYPHVKFGRCALTTAAPGLTMDPAGNLRACSISSTVLGNLVGESWASILDRARADYFARMAHIPAICRECALVDRCGGGCRESALTCFESLDEPDPLANA